MMIRTALRSTTAIASGSLSRPIVARGIARPVLAGIHSKRGYHEKVIDHYENPRNVGPIYQLSYLPSPSQSLDNTFDRLGEGSGGNLAEIDTDQTMISSPFSLIGY